MVKRTFQISDMHCPNCAMKIESLEDDLPGVKRVLASYQKGQAVFEYDDALLDEARIIAAIKKAGYCAEAMRV